MLSGFKNKAYIEKIAFKSASQLTKKTAIKAKHFQSHGHQRGKQYPKLNGYLSPLTSSLLEAIFQVPK